MFKARLLILFVGLSIFMSCVKKSTSDTCTYSESSTVAPAAEVANLQNWINSNHPTAIKHSSGFFYEISNAGTGTTTANVCSTVVVTYAGFLLNGVKFDSNTTGLSFQLGGLILGWQKGIPLIKTGGSINLYIPPSLGYGSTDVKDSFGNVVIPANSNLIFNIQLLGIQ